MFRTDEGVIPVFAVSMKPISNIQNLHSEFESQLSNF